MSKVAAEKQTLAVFTKFLFEEIPNVLRNNITSGKSKSILEFSLKDTNKNWPAKIALFEYQSEKNQYSFEVIKDDFMKYMQSICLSGRMSSQPSKTGKTFITVDTRLLIAYLEKSYPKLFEFPEIDWDSDITYNVFESFVLDEIPQIIKRCKMEGDKYSMIHFNLEDTGEECLSEIALFKYQSETNTYCVKVKKDEFMDYTLHLPFRRCLKPTKENHGRSWIQFSTDELYNYYIEELQREEQEKFTM